MNGNNPPMLKLGLFEWNELLTAAVEGAKKVYGERVGWMPEPKAIAPDWDYTVFKLGDPSVGGLSGITPKMGPMKPHWLGTLLSADVEAAPAKAKACGASILKEALEVPYTATLAVFLDPQGPAGALWKCSQTDPRQAKIPPRQAAENTSRRTP